MSQHSVLEHVCERCEVPRRTEAELFAISAELDETLLYPGIGLTHESFRLLRLLPSRANASEISCLLFPATQSQWNGKYVAGSYVCGPSSPTRTIYVNGSRFDVGENLFAFLRALQRYCLLDGQCVGIVLWIDAICIEQSSVKERNHQVSIMKQIFQNASATYSWLGPARDDSVWMFDALSLGHMFHQPPEDSGVSPHHKNVHKGLIGRRRLLRALVKFTERPYFTRLWILQEFVLAAKVVLFCGDQWMQLPVLTRWLDSIDASHHLWADGPKSVLNNLPRSMLHKMCRMRKTQFWTSDFEEIFCEFGSLACSLAHDKVYALRSLLPFKDTLSEKLPVRYDSNLNDLLRTVLRAGQLLDPLRFISKAIGELDIHPLDIPIQSLKAAGMYVDRAEYFSVLVQEDLAWCDRLNVRNARSKAAFVSAVAPYDFSSFAVVKLTSVSTFMQYLVVTSTTPNGHPAQAGRILLEAYGVLTRSQRDLELVPPPLLHAFRETFLLLTATTIGAWSPSQALNSPWHGRLRIRCDIFIALVHLSSLIDYYVSEGPASLTAAATLELQAWQYEMWILLEESSFWSGRLKPSYAFDWHIPAALTDRTMQVRYPYNPDYLRCQDHKSDYFLDDIESDDFFNWNKIDEARGRAHATPFEPTGM